jgi:uncharacterized protein
MTREVVFPSGELYLEGILHFPRVQEGARYAGAGVCHPHPLYGGDMHNNVVVAVCNALAAAGIAALRFNFRGVGRSGGTHGGGHHKREDAVAALEFLACQPAVDERSLCLAGYSFGAIVALSTHYPSLAALAAVSPPLTEDAGAAIKLACPTLLVFGERDKVAPMNKLESAGLELPPGSRVVTLPADHFWCGHEQEVAAKVAEFFQEHTEPK